MRVFIQGDLRKLKSIYAIYQNGESILKNQLIQNMFQQKNYNEDVKDIIRKLLNNYYPLNSHMELMNETDRTSVGLLFFKNIIDVLQNIEKDKSIPFYNEILKIYVFQIILIELHFKNKYGFLMK